MSKEANVAEDYVRDLERGVRPRVSVDVVVRLAQAMNVTVEDLLRGALADGAAAVLPEDWAELYGELDVKERGFVLGVGRALLELRLPVSEVEPLAAYEGVDLERERRKREP